MNGVSRKATRELGGWKTPGAMENVHNKATSEEVAPEMRSTINEACKLLDARAFPVDLDDDSCLDGEEAVGSDTGAAVCV